MLSWIRPFANLSLVLMVHQIAYMHLWRADPPLLVAKFLFLLAFNSAFQNAVLQYNVYPIAQNYTCSATSAIAASQSCCLPFGRPLERGQRA